MNFSTALPDLQEAEKESESSLKPILEEIKQQKDERIYDAGDSLEQLLQKLTAATDDYDDDDDEKSRLDFDQQKELVDGVKVKVDNYKYLLDKMAAQEELCKKWSKEFKDAEKLLERRAASLKAHLIYVMQKLDYQKAPGHRWIVSLRRGKAAVEVKGKPDGLAMLHYPDCVRIKYEWNLDALGKEIRMCNEQVKSIASFKHSWWPKFEVRKGDVECKKPTK